MLDGSSDSLEIGGGRSKQFEQLAHAAIQRPIPSATTDSASLSISATPPHMSPAARNALIVLLAGGLELLLLARVFSPLVLGDSSVVRGGSSATACSCFPLAPGMAGLMRERARGARAPLWAPSRSAPAITPERIPMRLE